MSDLFLNNSSLLHCLMVMGLVVGIGTMLGNIKFKNISLGPAAILFTGIIVSHFGLRVNPSYASDIKDFGLALFVFTLGLQVGPGFIQTFRKGGFRYTEIGLLSMLTSTALALLLLWGKEPMHIISGILSGAITSTPAMAAVQQTYADVVTAASQTATAAATAAAQATQAATVATAAEPAITATATQTAATILEGSAAIANAYALTYPLGTFGVILALILLQLIFKPNADSEGWRPVQTTSFSYIITNPEVIGLTIKEFAKKFNDHNIVFSRFYRDGNFILATGDTVLMKNDKVNVVMPVTSRDTAARYFGVLLPSQDVFDSVADADNKNVKIVITNRSMTGKTLSQLKLRTKYGVNITRLTRAGVEIVAEADTILQVGDELRVVGSSGAINNVANLFGNTVANLDKPNIVPIFLGICFGLFLGSIPFIIPGIPHPIKLGLAGGVLISAILISYLGPRLHVTTYVPVSASKMINIIGLSVFFACTGLNAGATFMDSFLAGGYSWVLYGALITIVPPFLWGIIALKVFKLDFPVMCGVISGANSNPSAMTMSQTQFNDSRVGVAYASVYPFSIFFRVIVAQLLILATI